MDGTTKQAIAELKEDIARVTREIKGLKYRRVV
jgi:hypothetical protein